ncbi:MAG TPA: GAF domain-containing protein [Chloroflexota bacterium]|nr:GAF domain-containing protein [Chloroflexota bacterium]
MGELIADIRRRGDHLVREGEAQQAREVARLLALHEAAVALAAPVAPEPNAVRGLFATVVRAAREALGAAYGRLVLIADTAWHDLLLIEPPHKAVTDGIAEGEPRESTARSGQLALSLGGEEGRPTRWTWLRPGGPYSHVIATGEPVYLPDLRADERFGPHPYRLAQGVHSLSVVPLVVAGRVLGALAVNYREPTELDADDRRALDLFAAHAAAAVERLRARHAEYRRAAQAERITQILASVAAATDLVGALEALVRGAVSLLGGTIGTARAVDPTTREHLAAVSLQADGAITVKQPAGPAWQGGLTEAIEAGGPAMLVDDYWALDPKTYPLYEHMRRKGLRSAVNVPIDANGKRIGSLAFDHPEPGYFTSTDLALAEALAAHAGAVLERIQQETARHERARLDGAMLVARTVAHEINNALSPIVGYAELLGQRPGVVSDPPAADYVRLICEAAEDAAGKVSRLQRIVRLREEPSPLGADQPILDMDRSTQGPQA